MGLVMLVFLLLTAALFFGLLYLSRWFRERGE